MFGVGFFSGDSGLVPAGRPTKPDSQPVFDWLPLFSRYGAVAGYFMAPLANAGVDSSLLAQLGWLSQSACSTPALSASRLPKSCHGSDTILLVRVAAIRLLNELSLAEIIDTASTLGRSGYRLAVFLSDRELGDSVCLRQLRRALFRLSDAGVVPVISDPVEDLASVHLGVRMIRRAASIIAVTPKWLGIGDTEAYFDRPLYLARSRQLRRLAHENAACLMFDGVASEWHMNFLASLPFTLHGGPADLTLLRVSA